MGLPARRSVPPAFVDKPELPSPLPQPVKAAGAGPCERTTPRALDPRQELVPRVSLDRGIEAGVLPDAAIGCPSPNEPSEPLSTPARLGPKGSQGFSNAVREPGRRLDPCPPRQFSEGGIEVADPAQGGQEIRGPAGNRLALARDSTPEEVGSERAMPVVDSLGIQCEVGGLAFGRSTPGRGSRRHGRSGTPAVPSRSRESGRRCVRRYPCRRPSDGKAPIRRRSL